MKQLDHVQVPVSDVISSADWYRNVLGMKVIGRTPQGPVLVRTGAASLALTQVTGEGVRPSPWQRVTFRADRWGFERAQQHLTRLGVRYRGPIDHGEALSLCFNDPDGNPLEIVHYL